MIFTKMFNFLRKNSPMRPPMPTDALELLENNPSLDGFHVVFHRQYTDYGYGAYPRESYTCMEYLGSTSSQEVLDKVLTELSRGIILDRISVVKGRFYDLESISENYTESVQKTRTIGYKLKESV